MKEKDENHKTSERALTLENIFPDDIMNTNQRPIIADRDSRSFLSIAEGNLIRYNFNLPKNQEVLLTQKEFKKQTGHNPDFSSIIWNSDKKGFLIKADIEKIYRRSSSYFLYYYMPEKGTFNRISEKKIRESAFSPDGTRIAYVEGHNIFLYDIKQKTTTQITYDGLDNHILNGHTDWVYEEEFAFCRAFEWSTDSRFIAYYRTDESEVATYRFAMYGNKDQEFYEYKYPLAGKKNAKVEIHVRNIETGKVNILKTGLEDSDGYIPFVGWMGNSNRLALVILNRHQNHIKIQAYDFNKDPTLPILLYEEQDSCYIDFQRNNLYFFRDGNHFLFSSEKNGYASLYYRGNGSEIQLTPSKFDIDQLIATDEAKGKIYLSAAYRNSLCKDFISISLKGNQAPICNVMDARVGSHDVTISKDFKYYTDQFSTITEPTETALYHLPSGKRIRSLQDNKEIKELEKKFRLGNPTFLKIPIENHQWLNAWILKPAHFSPKKRYPLLMCNYGGPGSQMVKNAWGSTSSFHQYLASCGMIVACVDNTGTAFRGASFKKRTYLRLGDLEIKDQIAAAKYLGQLPYVNEKRIGHWGWSFGGYMSCLAISRGADIFHASIAVAPVTNWEYYDTVYTERYMKTPSENPEGYAQCSPIPNVSSIKGHFLLIHGTADDNVHFCNSAALADAMINQGIVFESAFYPDCNHRINRGNALLHVYKRMEIFIREHLLNE